MKLDKNNSEFYHAVEFAINTNQSIYLTGKAGTGKTTYLKHLKEKCKKNMVVLAPTGVAAINAGGVTINSFFHIPFGPFVPTDPRLATAENTYDNRQSIYTTFKYKSDKKDLLHNLELMVIDEVSMVRCDTLDVIDRILRVFRRKPNQPFGGVQVILIGDVFQLPPVVIESEQPILKEFYESPFFFSATSYSKVDWVHIELKKIYRQQNQVFIDLLNRIRQNNVTNEDIKMFNAKLDPNFNGFENGFITLATHRHSVDEINRRNLYQLKGKLFEFQAEVEGVFPNEAMPTDKNLKLKIGAQVMFVKNDPSKAKKYFNGKIGTIQDITEDKKIIIATKNEKIVVQQEKWENYAYSYNSGSKSISKVTLGTFTQYPLKLAWAITVHKSQGLTFDKVIVDLNRSFCSGQVYVAISRCTTLDGIVLKSRIQRSSIIVDRQIIEFENSVTSEIDLQEKMNRVRVDQHSNHARSLYEKGDLAEAVEEYTKAIKIAPNSSDLYCQRGAVTLELSKLKKNRINGYAELLADFDKALKLNPENHLAYFGRGECKVELNDIQGAIEAYTNAIDLKPYFAKAYNSRADAKFSSGDEEGAQEDFDRATIIDSKF